MPGAETGPGQPVTRSARVVARLRSGILDGTLPPDQPLREQALAERYSVSRRTVREALLALEDQGLVVRRHNSGAAVRSFTPEDIADLYRVRRMLECEGARNAVTADADRLAAVSEAFEVMERAARDGVDSVAVAEADMAFHGAVIALTASARIDEFYERIGTQMTYAITMLQRHGVADSTVAGGVLAEHRAIRDALVHRDIYDAQRLILEHIGIYEGALVDVGLPGAPGGPDGPGARPAPGRRGRTGSRAPRR